MLRLTLAFTAALISHIILLWLPLPDSSEPHPRLVSREVTIDLSSKIRKTQAEDKQTVQEKEGEQPSAKNAPQTEAKQEKDLPPAAKSRDEKKRRAQPVKHLRPVHFKKKVVTKRKQPSVRQAPPEPEKSARPSSKTAPSVSERLKDPSPQPLKKKKAGSVSPQKETPKRKAPAFRETGPATTSQTQVEKASPLYAENPPPPYPFIAKRRGWQGRVILQVDVSRQGEVETAAVKKSSGYDILDQAALKAVEGWRFKPGRRNGGAVAMKVEIPVHFKIE